MKEINNLEDFKSLFPNPVFKYMQHEQYGKVFVLSNEGILCIALKEDGFIVATAERGFTDLPEPLLITQEMCQQWAKSEDAKDCEIGHSSVGWVNPEQRTFKSYNEYKVRDIMPTQAETEATEQPLEPRVRKWVLAKRGEG